MSLAEVPTTELHDAWAHVLGAPVVSATPCLGGRNHRVEQLTCANGQRAVVKRDVAHGADGRRRLEVEFSSLQFLWRHGVRCIPQPLGAEPEHGWALYQFIDGDRVPAEQVHDDDIDQVVRFAGQLQALRRSEDSRGVSLASEACFSIEDLLAAIHRRLTRLQGLSDETPLASDLRAFVTVAFLPHLEQVTQCAARALAAMGLSSASRLAQAFWALSPSDFGFHNAVKRRDGQVIFVDFEYFGWDDPAKMIDDFILHPGMSLSEPHIRRAVQGFVQCFQNDPQIVKRAELLWPLCGFNWCLIFLNEFLPTGWLRRGFANREGLERLDVLAEQLAKARQMLHRVVTDDGDIFHGC